MKDIKKDSSEFIHRFPYVSINNIYGLPKNLNQKETFDQLDEINKRKASGSQQIDNENTQHFPQPALNLDQQEQFPSDLEIVNSSMDDDIKASFLEIFNNYIKLKYIDRLATERLDDDHQFASSMNELKQEIIMNNRSKIKELINSVIITLERFVPYYYSEYECHIYDKQYEKILIQIRILLESMYSYMGL